MRVVPTQRVLTYGGVCAGVSVLLLSIAPHVLLMAGAVICLIVLVLALM